MSKDVLVDDVLNFASEDTVPIGCSAAMRSMFQNEHFRSVVEACWKIYDQKGIDYTRGKGDEDRLDNFRRAAENNGVTFIQAWGVYFYKHISAVWKFAKDGKVESEPIEGRLYDVINYSILLLLWRSVLSARLIVLLL